MQAGKSLPLSGAVLLLCRADFTLRAHGLFTHRFIFQDVVAGFHLLSIHKLQHAEVVSCRGLLHLLSQVENVLGGL